MALSHFSDLPNTNLLCTLDISTLNTIYSSLLESTISHNNPSTTLTRGPITRFHSKLPPPLHSKDYLNRLTKFTPFPRDALLLSSVYLNRISHSSLSTAYNPSSTFCDSPRPPPERDRCPQPLIPSFEPNRPDPIVLISPFLLPTSTSNSNSQTPNLSLSSSPPIPIPPPSSISTKHRPSTAPLLNLYTVHRLILSTLLISTKYTVDGTLSQSRAAKVGGVSQTELTRLEIEGLRLLGWGLWVGVEELEGVAREWVGRGRELGLINSVEEEKEKEAEEEEGEGEKVNGELCQLGRGGSISPIPFDIISSPISPSGLEISTEQHLKIPSVPIPPPLSTSSSSTSVSSHSLPSASTSASSVEGASLEEAVRRAKEDERNGEVGGNSNAGTPTKGMARIGLGDEKDGAGQIEKESGELIEVK
ncbi:hypothetical protein JCM5353_002143 [Sporobolomyces roseus]